MSRPTIVRRLTAVIALLAVLCLALPAVAAPGAHGPSHRTRAVHASSLVDQLFAWIGSFLPGQTGSHGAGWTEKTTATPVSPIRGNALMPPASSEAGTLIDPNG
jgi:hypothetical protein